MKGLHTVFSRVAVQQPVSPHTYLRIHLFHLIFYQQRHPSGHQLQYFLQPRHLLICPQKPQGIGLRCIQLLDTSGAATHTPQLRIVEHHRDAVLRQPHIQFDAVSGLRRKRKRPERILRCVAVIVI